MKRRFLSFFALLTLAVEASSDCLPMLVEGRTWKYVYRVTEYGGLEREVISTTDYDYSWTVCGDTVADGRECKKIYCDSPSGHQLYGLAYEEGCKVLICHLFTEPAFYPFCEENQWYELYDFDAPVGSKTSLLANNTVWGTGTASVKGREWKYIDAVESLGKEGIILHRYIVEGVGCDKGLFDNDNIITNGSSSKYIGCYDGNECIFSAEDFNTLNYDKKCATPTIAYDNGRLLFSCETEGAECVYEINCADSGSGCGGEVSLGQSYEIRVHATLDGWQDSDVATATIGWRNGRPVMEGFSSVTMDGTDGIGDVNGDGQVDVADIARIITIMAEQASE